MVREDSEAARVLRPARYGARETCDCVFDYTFCPPRATRASTLKVCP
jgi:hypothetical protein